MRGFEGLSAIIGHTEGRRVGITIEDGGGMRAIAKTMRGNKLHDRCLLRVNQLPKSFSQSGTLGCLSRRGSAEVLRKLTITSLLRNFPP